MYIHNLFEVDDICELMVSSETVVERILQKLDSSGAQMVVVVDDKKRMLGSITDGDVRRGLLRGESLQSKAYKIMNHNYRFMYNDSDESNAYEIMKKESLRYIPILDKDGVIKRIISLNEFLEPEKIRNPVVIMAGGKGMRLRPLTEDCPKPMLLVGGKPMLKILLEQFIASGFEEFYFSVNYLKDKIINHFENGERWGVNIRYINEDKPLGTAGSLKLLPSNIKRPFIVINGDVLTRLNTIQLLRFHIDHDALATICVREYEMKVPFGVVQVDGVELKGFKEKPRIRQLVNAGIYVINPALIESIKDGQVIDMPELLLNESNESRRVTVYPIHEYWLDVGRPESLEEAHATWEELK